MSEFSEWNPITTAALREVRKSLAALLLELPESVWRGHKGTVETAISQMVEDQLAMRAERDTYREALTRIIDYEEMNVTPVGGDDGAAEIARDALRPDQVT